MTARRRFFTLTAPLWMLCGVFVAAIAGVFVYLGLGFAFSELRNWVPVWLQLALGSIYVLSPLFIGLLILGGVSRGLLTEERAERPGVGRHVWHCAVFYPVVLWTIYQLIDCPRRGVHPPVPARCADPMGASLALGLGSLAAVLADIWAVWRWRRVDRAV